jgi:serine/threonine-protein kinase
MAEPTIADDPSALPAGARVGEYEVLTRLGAGGVAAVYAVRHARRGSVHALKIPVIDRPSVRARAEREGQVQREIRHPNVVAVTDVADFLGRPALVMEYVAGPSLEQLLALRPLTLPEVDLLARQVLRGVARAHALGAVHRDLKPGNLLLHCIDGRIVAKVADFGIVKPHRPEDRRFTHVGTMMGTPPYMSPEQFEDSATVDARADVWALGVVLYELVTGRRPFDGEGTAALYAQICAGRYEPLAGVPARMAEAIEGALRPKREDRWADAAALLDAWRGPRPDDAVMGWRPETVAFARSMAPVMPTAPRPPAPAPAPYVGMALMGALATMSVVVGAVLGWMLA